MWLAMTHLPWLEPFLPLALPAAAPEKRPFLPSKGPGFLRLFLQVLP